MAVGKRKCKSCGEFVRDFIVTPKGVFCSVEVAVKWAYKNKSKGAKVVNKNFKSETRSLKESIKKRTGKNGHYDNLKTQLHKWIKHVLRKGDPCYTCDLKQSYGDSPQSFHVGHFIPQKQVDPRRFMLINLRIQCYKCNAIHSGMRAEYRARLINEVGVDKVEWLECDVNHKSLKEQYPEVSDIKLETSRYRLLTKLI